jgi:hypothetical protein
MAGLASSSARAARAGDPQAFRWIRAIRGGPLLMLLVIMPLHAARWSHRHPAHLLAGW